ncbi:tyrosine-type recombinase/integrase [Nocardia sp. GP40]|uniref:tyrosine-type recombinase/integrase n=1 Tax=Nocardia sp. GP40 TaxID=3156268 RepID=UPI003D263351
MNVSGSLPAVTRQNASISRSGLILQNDVRSDDITFAEYVNGWFDEQDLAETTTANYASYIQCHLLPKFGSMYLREITKGTVSAWEKEERAAGYAVATIRTIRAILHVILEDAVEEGRILRNPATKRRNRGQRMGAERVQGKVKVITDAIGALLIAERMALLSGRDDEFVFEIIKWYTGMRFGELRGLEVEFVKNRRIEVQWQIVEVGGEFIRRRPKMGKTRTIHLPEFLWQIVNGFIVRSSRRPCACHGLTYVFCGYGKKQPESGVTATALAKHLGVSQTSVTKSMQARGRVSDAMRQRVRQAATELGYIPEADRDDVDHHRRGSFHESIFAPAVSGVYPRRGTCLSHPVPVSVDPFPGVPIRGRGASKRADGVWQPIADGMTPHGNRRSHRTNLVELGTPNKLIDARLGHSDPSVQAIYTEVTQVMIDKLMADLTAVWNDALDKRFAMCPTSPVSILNGLLQVRARETDQQERSIAA